MNIVADCWGELNISGRCYFVLIEKLRRLKEVLRKWNKEVFGFRDLRIENIVKDLNEADNVAAAGGSPGADSRRLLTSEFWKEIRIKESLLAQKSRVKWVAEGDANSRFFHACIRSNIRRTQIVKLCVDNQWIEDVAGVKRAIKDHFEDSFKEGDCSRPVLEGVSFRQLNLEENDMLTAPFTLDEIKEVVWECDGNKCPGPDGFNINFIKSCWDIIGLDVLNFFNEFHSLARVPKAVCASFMTLIPKVQNPQKLGEYRPISLIGCLYKMLAKVLAGRLKRIMSKVISSTQNAFLAGRNILDGVVVVNEVIDMAARLKKKCLLLKVDFQKAYDTVSWNYLDYMLYRLGFCAKWRRWMQACYSSTSISVLVNGSPTEEFVAQKGIKQGDPLAPFLFLIAAEGLAGLVRKSEEVGCLKGFNVSNELSVSLLQFADDTIFLCDGSDSNVWCLKALLRSFEMASGLKINFAKSNVIGLNMDERVIDGISSFLACSVGSVPFKFLGVPVGANPRRASMWQPVIDSIKSRLTHWRSIKLSFGGRVALINSVMAALPLYWFSMFKAPKKVITEIQRLQRRFLWGGDEESKKIAWVSWKQICTPKQVGGLGIKDLHAFNLALVAKWRWRCVVDDDASLWKRVIFARYGFTRSWFGDSLPNNIARRASIWWRDLHLLGDGGQIPNSWFNEVTKRRIGNGASVSFWFDKWIGVDTLASLFPSVLADCDCKESTVLNMGHWTHTGWRWDWLWTERLPVAVAESVVGLKDLLVGIEPNRDVEDKWVWLPDSVGGFSVKSCYCWLSSRSPVVSMSVNDTVIDACCRLWRNDLPSKVLIFSWRLLLDRLPSRLNLLVRGVLPDTADMNCVLCGLEPETADHLFCRCRVAREVWQRIFAWLDRSCDACDEVVLLYNAVGDLVNGRKAKKVKHLFWVATTWQIWLARNKQIFNGANASVSGIVTAVKYVSWGWFIARIGRSSGLLFSDWYSSPMGCISSL